MTETNPPDGGSPQRKRTTIRAENAYTLAQLARGILQIADAAGMPDTFWQSDSRVRMARDVLGVPDDGRYTHAHLWETPESASREIES
jgi:hypothetical protein